MLMVMEHAVQPAINIENVTKRYGKDRGIKNISLKVMPGEVFGFIGPNGAGKSTTINTILDNIRATSGTITIFDEDSHLNSKSVHKKIGYLSGDMETDPSLTGKQYLTFVAHLRGGVKKEKIDELCERLQCTTNKKIRHLSRGNKQKIGLVSALMHDPDLLILDEPTSGLDPLMQAEFNAIINERKERGKTTFMSSHVLSEVQETCDRVGFIRDGELIVVSSLDDLFKNAPRQISVKTIHTPDDTLFKNLSGVKQYAVDGSTISFLFTGDLNELVREIATIDVADVQIFEPDLEYLFMSYYESKETK